MKKILGIIVEFNPLHNGHLYFINEAKKELNPDVTIAVVSSSFTMRGDVMVMDKFDRTKFMLEAGIDLILELPFISAVQSSDYFCYNAIKILNSFNITHLAFGAELQSLNKLLTLYDLINQDAFHSYLKTSLDMGHSYPTSSLKALKKLTKDQELINNFSLPNNTLALGYINAINKINPNINIITIKRINSNFYDEAPTNENIASANAIRKLMIENKEYKNFIPEFMHRYQFINQQQAEENLLLLLRHTFNMLSLSQISSFLGVNEGIENRIANLLPHATTYQELISLIETKRYPKNRIKRTLLHIILQTPKEYENKANYYLRILGFNKKGEKHLSTLSQEIKEKLLSNLKNMTNHDIINMELKASRLYSLITNNKEFYKQEFSGPIKYQ